jgi:catechol 2,3-dioxygenase-like lactoylglutathione lyase family enzyme
MLAHDGIQLVFLERAAKPETVSSKGYGVALQMTAVVPDIEREVAFFQDVLGLELLSKGPPPAAGPDVRIVGARGSRFGRLALVHHAGTAGLDLYPRAVPPARGLLSVTYVVPDIAPILARGRASGVADHGTVRSILGEGRMASVTSPAGLRIDFIQL